MVSEPVEAPRWEYTTIAHHYRVRMVFSQVIPKLESGRAEVKKYANTYVEHRMHLAGPIHSEPYGYDAAQVMVRTFLAPYLALGWRIESLTINGWDAKDA